MIGAIIQARVGSTRLPRKVLRNLCGQPLIWHIYNRVKLSKYIDSIILATTNNIEDNALIDWAIKNNIKYFRGDENDVLSRFYHASKAFSLDTIVRITADDPLKDPEIIDKVIKLFHDEELDFANNNNPPSFPEGLDVEVFSFNALENAYFNSTEMFEREHVTQYFYHNPNYFKQSSLFNSIDLSHMRWTIDTEQDWEMIEFIYSKLYHKKRIFMMDEILNLLIKYPNIVNINKDVQRSAMYNK